MCDTIEIWFALPSFLLWMFLRSWDDWQSRLMSLMYLTGDAELLYLLLPMTCRGRMVVRLVLLSLVQYSSILFCYYLFSYFLPIIAFFDIFLVELP